MVDEEVKSWGFWVVILGWSATIGKFIQVITQQGKLVDKLNKDNEDKSAVLFKLSERSEKMEKYIDRLEKQNHDFTKSMEVTALAINSINSSIEHLTDLAERNIDLANKRFGALEDKNKEYDENIKEFYQKYDLPLKK